ncbi:MAG: TPM domain-containing protein [Flavobacterium sp.]
MIKLILKAYHFVLVIIALLLSQFTYAQFDVPEKPSFQTSVYDYATILDTNQKQQLEQKLIAYSDSTSTQIVLITIPSLKGEDIGMLGPKWGQEWGIGQKGKDNGIVILMAAKERKIGIYPGYGVEHKITAGQGGEIIRNIIIPEFKRNDYYAGLDKGTDAIFELLTGTYQADKTIRSDGENSLGGLLCLGVIIFMIVFAIISSNKNNKGGGGGNHRNRNVAGTLLDILVLSSLGRGSGGGGGSFGGGGFGGGGGGFGGGFGGGGFSGGGSSGSW